MPRRPPAPRFPEGWPPEAKELYGEFARKQLHRLCSAPSQLGLLAHFLHFQAERGLTYREFPTRLLDDFMELQPRRRLRYVSGAIRSWLRFLYRRQELLFPLYEEMIWNPKGLPSKRFRSYLSYSQVRTLLELPDVTTLRGLRDRALLEMAYGSGLRRGELFALDLQHVDLTAGQVHIEESKNSYSRIVPLTHWAMHFLGRYLREVRPLLASPLSGNALWLSTDFGRQLNPVGLGRLLDKLCLRTEPRFHCTPHQLRHAFATHLLQAGAPLVDIQALLGHRSIESTAVYTRLTSHYLSRAHRQSHPRNKDGFWGC